MKLNVICPDCGKMKPEPDRPCPVCAAAGRGANRQDVAGAGAAEGRAADAASESPGAAEAGDDGGAEAAGSPFVAGYEPVRVEMPQPVAAPWAGVDEQRLVLIQTAAACVTTSLILLVAAAATSFFFAGGAIAIAALGSVLAAVGMLSRRGREAATLLAIHLVLLLSATVASADSGIETALGRVVALVAILAAAAIAARQPFGRLRDRLARRRGG